MQGSCPLVDLKVLLPTMEVVTVKVRRNSTAAEVYRLVVVAVKLKPENADFFALFEIVEHNFGRWNSRVELCAVAISCFAERKLQPNEFPHALYIANYSTAASTCLVVRRWLFDTDTEREIDESDFVAREFLFRQAIEDVNRGQVNTEDKLYQLKALQDANKQIEV
jgi:sorting nexin-27